MWFRGLYIVLDRRFSIQCLMKSIRRFSVDLSLPFGVPHPVEWISATTEMHRY